MRIQVAIPSNRSEISIKLSRITSLKKLSRNPFKQVRNFNRDFFPSITLEKAVAIPSNRSEISIISKKPLSYFRFAGRNPFKQVRNFNSSKRIT